MLTPRAFPSPLFRGHLRLRPHLHYPLSRFPATWAASANPRRPPPSTVLR